jgi:D-beta-D-heptose 7-phosphate kinase/D-beta-D-heptose 1-phosphate adenosyltransferase
MEEEIARERFEEIVRKFEGISVLVIGDLMIDEYLRGSVRRISQESPVMVVEVESDEFKPGGAANVGNNLRSLGARVAMAGVVGDDEGGRMLRMEMAAWKIDTSGILTDTTRPTTRKTRVIAQNQQVLRVDREQTNPVSDGISERLVSYIAETIQTVDAVLVSDYRKGVLTQATAGQAINLARTAGKLLITNPKPASAPWLRGAGVLSLNRSEAEELGRRRLTGNEDGEREFGAALRSELDVDTLVITWGAKGLSYWRQDGDYRYVPAHRVEVADVAGAGDTTIGAMTLSLLAGANTYEAAIIASRAGACVVRKSGVAVVTPDELLRATADSA